ncbi:MAG: DUF6456 domain-containing protein [Alphaproteobacteria bacterium]
MKITDKKEKTSEVEAVLFHLGEFQAVGRLTDGGGMGVFVPRNRFARPVLVAGEKAVRQLMTEELILASDKTPGEWRISRLGRARLRRRQAPDSPYRSQHQILDLKEQRTEKGEAVVVRVNHAESPLGWLVSHKDKHGKPLITIEQFAAGERLRRDFTLANLAPRVTASWGMPINRAGRGAGSDQASMNDTMIAAKDRLWAAIDAVGPDLGGILLQVCCYLNGLAAAERHLGWPVRAGKVVLGIALDRLAAYYGIARKDAPKNRPGVHSPRTVHVSDENNLHNT